MRELIVAADGDVPAASGSNTRPRGGTAVPSRHGGATTGCGAACHRTKRSAARGSARAWSPTASRRRARRWASAGSMARVGDLRHAVRALTRNRGFGTVAVLVLAASVAINTLIFFMLDGVVLRPLPYAIARAARAHLRGERGPAEVPAVDRPLPRLPRQRARRSRHRALHRAGHGAERRRRPLASS